MMMAKGALLFLLGTTLTSAHFFHRTSLPAFKPLKSNGCPSGPELAPIICKFMQTNINPQFKPQLIAPTTYIAPLVVEKCEKPQIQMDIELPAPVEEFKPVVIPEAPELPPMTIQNLPVPIIFEDPPAPLPEPCEADLPVMPFVNIATPLIEVKPEPCLNDEIPEITLNTIELEPISMPQPPELPKFIMPEIPAYVAPEPSAPCLEDEPIPAPIPANIEPLPTAPELPAFVMPELPATPCLEDETIAAPIPAYVGPLPAAPELPAFVMPELPSIQVVEPELPMPVAPCLEDEPIPAPIPAYIEPVVSLPAAPELPAFVMPELPTIQVSEPEPMPVAPCLEDEPIPAPIPAYIEPVVSLPAAPELPYFVMPELPTIQVSEPELSLPVAPCLDDEPIPAPIPAYVEPIAPMPAAPELPAFVMPEPAILEPESPMPVVHYLEDEPIPSEPLAPLPAAPELPTFVMPELPAEIPALRQPLTEYNMVDYEPMPVPQAPAFVMPAAPCLEDSSAPIAIPEYIQPLAPVPAAPELPPASLPELPLRMGVPSPVIIAESNPCLTEEKPAPEPILIPQQPALSEIRMPELPVSLPAPCGPDMSNPFYQKLFPNLITIYNEKAEQTQNILLPSQTIESTPCVYNLVMKHVMPNMFSNNYRSMDNIEIKPASFSPCS